MSWTWLAALPDGTHLDELTTARDRRVTWRLRDQCDAGLKMTSGGDVDQSLLIEELRTDLILTWNDQAHFRGRFGPSADTFDETSHEVEFGAIDYRGALTRRFTHTAIDLEGVDLAEAGWQLIDHTQRGTGLAGGPLGIGRGPLPTIATADVAHPVGKQIAEAIDEASKRYPGFDWWIDADMQYQAAAWRGSREPRDFALILGTTVAGGGTTFDPAAYANAWIQTGADGLDPAILGATDLGTDARREGRWESVGADGDLATQAAVDDTAVINLARAGALPVAYRCRLKPGMWTPDQLWLGDLVRIVIRSGRKDIDARERVIEISITDSPDGPPVVEITVGNTLAADLAALLRRMPARLTTLARR